jgi:prolyl oligopeptidase
MMAASGPARVLLVLILFGAWCQTADTQAPHYPAARRGSLVDDYRGVTIPDPYRWLEQIDSAATRRWVRQQEGFTSRWLTNHTGRRAIRHRLDLAWDRVSVGVPWREAGRLFYEMSAGPDEQSALYVQNGLDGPSQAVLDPNRMSRSGSIAFRDFSVAPDGRWVAYTEAPGGADAAATRVHDVTTARPARDKVRGVLGTVCWTHDAHGFFYVASSRNAGSTDNARIDKLLAYHVLGDPQARDRRIREWTDNYRWGYCMLSEDGRYAIVVAERGAESELYTIDLVDAAHPTITAPLVRRLAGGHAFTPIGTLGDTLYVITDRDAPKRQVIALDLADPASATRRVVPESADVIEEAALTSNRIAVHYLSDAKSRLRVFTHDGHPAGDVSLPGIGSIGWGLSARSSAPDLFYSFTTLLVPKTVYHFDGRNGASAPFRPPAATVDAESFETRQVFYRSKDGTQVPMFIAARKDVPLDGRNPTLLTAYGGYGATLKPEFQPDVLLWLQRGGVYALANIRGGGEYGEEWHRAGMLDHKQTSFDDFIAAAEHLVSERVTSPQRLAIYGHSNGGLLVGAAITQRPDLFGAAVANAGHYDMLRFHRFTVGAGWIPEYGSPDDPRAFGYLRAYSPLHNVRAGVCYPSTLLLAADHDDRVPSSHAYKFAAALQAAQACDRPILLRVARQASHSYASKNTRLAELSDMWAFIEAQLNANVRN